MNRILGIVLSFLVLSAVFLAAVCSASEVPEIEWQHNYGGSTNDYAYDIHVTSDGGYIVAGTTFSGDGDVTGYQDNGDYWVVKLDRNGAIDWQRALGGTGLDMAYRVQQTRDGGYIVAGRSQSTDGNVTHPKAGPEDYWIVKLNSAGVIEWDQSLGGTGGDVAKSIIQTNDGGYIVAGYSNSKDGDVTHPKGNNDYWIVKLNSAGVIEWDQSFSRTGYGDNEAADIRQTTDGGYIVAGTSYSKSGDTITSPFEGDYWIVKLDSAGVIEWDRLYRAIDLEPGWGGWGDQRTTGAKSIVQTVDGGYIVTGNNFFFNGNSYPARSIDYWVVKLDSTGGEQWNRSLGGTGFDEAADIIQTSDGGYAVIGMSNSRDGDVTNPIDLRGYPVMTRDYWVVKLDKNGGTEWDLSLGGSGQDEGSSIASTQDGGYIVAGNSSSTDGDITSPLGGYDFWIVKLGKPTPAANSSFFIHIDTVCPQCVGNKLTINATTNLPVGEEVLAEIYSTTFQPSQKSQSGEFSGATGTVKVVAGPGIINQTAFDTDLSTFRPDTYRITETAMHYPVSDAREFIVMPGSSLCWQSGYTVMPLLEMISGVILGLCALAVSLLVIRRVRQD
jgi:hypothetical protein